MCDCTTSSRNQAPLSKTRYCHAWQCPKILWCDANVPEYRNISDDAQERMKNGTVLGRLACELFAGIENATVYDEVGNPNENAMVRKTAELMANGTRNIAEASFAHGGEFCSVDILSRKDDKTSWDIYEVKSSTDSDKSVYRADVAFQKSLLEKCGVDVGRCYLVNVDKSYEKNGEIEIDKLFVIEDITSDIEAEQARVEQICKQASEMLASTQEPHIQLSRACQKPYPCPYQAYCMRDIPENSVFDLYGKGTSFEKKTKLAESGAVTFEQLEDVLSDKTKTDRIRLRQVKHTLYKLPEHVDTKALTKFSDAAHAENYYFFDFETEQTAIPKYDHAHPYDQIPVQYSLHRLDSCGMLTHMEFLGDGKTDPRRALAEQLVHDIDIESNYVVFAYNKSFEANRINELSMLFDDLKPALDDIREHLVDLMEPFTNGWWYNYRMKGSFSVKSVLPALFPDDPELDYSSLDGVHNGVQAMQEYAALGDMSGDTLLAARDNLLRYCELDTYALVKIWQKLLELVSNR